MLLKHSILAKALVESMNKTCINCGSIKDLCNCGNFQNVWDLINNPDFKQED